MIKERKSKWVKKFLLEKGIDSKKYTILNSGYLIYQFLPDEIKKEIEKEYVIMINNCIEKVENLIETGEINNNTKTNIMKKILKGIDGIFDFKGATKKTSPRISIIYYNDLKEYIIY